MYTANYFPQKEHFVNHLYIFGHIKSRLGKMVLIGNESLEEDDGITWNIGCSSLTLLSLTMTVVACRVNLFTHTTHTDNDSSSLQSEPLHSHCSC